MIRQFYANPPTNSQEVADLYAFPDSKALLAWRLERRGLEQGRNFTQVLTDDPKTLLAGVGTVIGIRFIFDLMGPTGDALKIMRNKAMPRVKFYGLRVVPFAIFAAIFHSYRSELSFANPYSKGELK